MNKFSLKILKKLRVLPYLNLKGSIILNQTRFTIPIIQNTGYDNMFMSEPWMVALMKVILKNENKCFIDVGVNIGQTLLKLKSVSDKIKYIGFEPNPLCIFYVKNLIKENNFTDCHLIPVGLSDSTGIGVLNFFSDSTTDSSASIISDFRPNLKIVRKEYVSLFQVDQIKEQIGFNEFSILKIDVEGAELEVIKSFLSLIEQNKPIILIEILPAYDETNTDRIERQNEIVRIVTAIDYSIYRVIKQNDKFLHLKEIFNIELHSDMNLCEYVMIPSDKKDKIKSHDPMIIT
ncbi:MAG TPA: FkbM family methyltransferase [Ohtaekwangia sp.]|nr:FkbM family methyltransferase [Ohtaekwangia sp.]